MTFPADFNSSTWSLAPKSISRRVAVNNVTINKLLPERIDSSRQIYMAKIASKNENISYEEARTRITDNLATKTMGLTEEFDVACAFCVVVSLDISQGRISH